MKYEVQLRSNVSLWAHQSPPNRWQIERVPGISNTPQEVQLNHQQTICT